MVNFGKAKGRDTELYLTGDAREMAKKYDYACSYR